MSKLLLILSTVFAMSGTIIFDSIRLIRVYFINFMSLPHFWMYEVQMLQLFNIIVY
jgi:hypothetical protein